MRHPSIAIVITLFIFKISSAQWNPNPAVNTTVCTASYDQKEVRVISDSKGGAIAAWIDYRNDPTDSLNADIYVQRMDKYGYAKWTPDGVGACTDPSDQPSHNVVPDGVGGIIIVWKDERNMATDNNDIFAMRIDSSGNTVWGGSSGMNVCSSATNQKNPKAVTDGAGGVIISWEEKVNGRWIIRGQRINAGGTILWNSGGINISDPTIILDEKNQRIETDDNGGAIVVWERILDSTNYDIYAQKINASGQRQWPSLNGNGIVVVQKPDIQVNPKIEPDGNHGAIITWLDSVVGVGLNNIYAQRVNASGTLMWNINPPNGVNICVDAAYQGAPDMASEGMNGAIIAWKDWRGGNKDVYAQRVDTNGIVQWTINGIPIVSGPTDEGNPNLWGDGTGGVICVWQDDMASVMANVYAQRISSAGILSWNSGVKVPVGIAADIQTQPKHVVDGNGGAIFFFIDKRTGLYDIYAHHLYWNGTADGIEETKPLGNSICFPNPFSNEAVIELKDLNLNPEELELSVHDLYAREISMDHYRRANGFSIARNDISSGIYFYEIKSEGKLYSAGMFIITNK